MKKIIAIVLVLALSLSLVACGSDDVTTPTQTVSPTVAPQTEAPSVEETETPTSTVTPTVEPTVRPADDYVYLKPSLSITRPSTGDNSSSVEVWDGLTALTGDGEHSLDITKLTAQENKIQLSASEEFVGTLTIQGDVLEGTTVYIDMIGATVYVEGNIANLVAGTANTSLHIVGSVTNLTVTQGAVKVSGSVENASITGEDVASVEVSGEVKSLTIADTVICSPTIQVSGSVAIQNNAAGTKVIATGENAFVTVLSEGTADTYVELQEDAKGYIGSEETSMNTTAGVVAGGSSDNSGVTELTDSNSILFGEEKTVTEITADFVNYGTMIVSSAITNESNYEIVNKGVILASGEAGLKAAVAIGGNVMLADSVEVTSTTRIAGVVTLDLAGNSITASKEANEYAIITIASTGVFTLEDSVGGGEISGARNTAVAGGVSVLGTGKFIMNGGIITDNQASYGAGVNVNGGTFIMNGGSITGNRATSGAGGITFMGAPGNNAFEYTAGTICDNKTDAITEYVVDGVFNIWYNRAYYSSNEAVESLLAELLV